MSDESMFDNLSDLVSKVFGKETPPDLEDSGERENLLIESLKGMAGQSGSEIGIEVNEFLSGRGKLLDSTRLAVERSGSSATKDVEGILKQNFNLSPTVAKALAALLIKLFPSIAKITGEKETTKPKQARKKKTSAASAEKPASTKPRRRKTASSTEAASSGRPKRRKTSSSTDTSSNKAKKKKSSPNKKPTTAKKPTKRKTATAKKPVASRKTKRRTSSSRSTEIVVDEES